jgi:hypothetical protein
MSIKNDSNSAKIAKQAYLIAQRDRKNPHGGEQMRKAL